uniref:UDP-glycosyltransferases domain-containing protein n=1 Tax=Oryza barthii TaxID=65489 RepID=A0A0D3G9B3_9ORYZ
MFSVHYHFDRLPTATDIADGDEVGNYIPGLKSIRFSDLEPTHTNKNMVDLILEAYSHARKAQCVIFTSFYELESNAMDALRRDLPYPAFSAGPCIPYMALQADEHHAGDEEEEPYMAWLDAQPVGSVLYVSLGSFLSVSRPQLDEIAAGLADSKVTFLWVLRGDSGARDILRGGGGMVVPWTDQLKVLCHPSVGGFFTHSGMNSTLEGGDRRGGEEADGDGFRCGGGGRGEGDEEESFADARGLSRRGSRGWFFLQRRDVSDQLHFRVQELKLVCLKPLI